jgi:hypothetical protein
MNNKKIRIFSFIIWIIAIFCGAVIERFIPINGKYLFGFVAGNISLILLNIVGGEW